MAKQTEASSIYNNLESMSTFDLVFNINKEDKKVAKVVNNKIDEISNLIEIIFNKIQVGGRLFYIGSGTSGRLGVLDASECPPTFGVSKNMVIGIIAGGDKAIREAVESAEDDTHQAWLDLTEYNVCKKDVVIGLSASGTTPYVINGLKACQKNGIFTASITCNENIMISAYCDITISLIVGPEFVTGSTRMKAGTAQKMVLNMISTTIMIKLGHVIDNKMIDMKISNTKLKERAIRMIIEQCKVSQITAKKLLEKKGSVRKAINLYYEQKNTFRS